MDDNLKERRRFLYRFTGGSIVFLGLLALLWYIKASPQEQTQQSIHDNSLEQLAIYTNFREAYLAANGGQEKLNARQSMQTRGTLNNDEQSLPFRSIKQRPNQSLIVLKFPNYDLSLGVNGSVTWQRIQIKGKEPVYELKEGDEAIALQQMGEFFDPIMNVLLFNKREIQGIEPSERESKPTIRLNFKSETGTETSTYFAPETMQPQAQIESFANRDERKTLYADYRSIGGKQEPFLIETYENEDLKNRIKLEKCEQNIGTVAAIFEYPDQTTKHTSTD
jgi:hypothetical protein